MGFFPTIFRVNSTTLDNTRNPPFPQHLSHFCLRTQILYTLEYLPSPSTQQALCTTGLVPSASTSLMTWWDEWTFCSYSCSHKRSDCGRILILLATLSSKATTLLKNPALLVWYVLQAGTSLRCCCAAFVVFWVLVWSKQDHNKTKKDNFPN